MGNFNKLLPVGQWVFDKSRDKKYIANHLRETSVINKNIEVLEMLKFDGSPAWKKYMLNRLIFEVLLHIFIEYLK